MAQSPILFSITVLAALLTVMGEATSSHGATYINYTTITGFFLQDDPATNASTFNYVREIRCFVQNRCLKVYCRRYPT
jgi:hypothetical protein